ncbi:adenosine receptor A2a-like [Asterias rubens]|uniref:adenosine receptor A2a-like n=1 Tax=Asterias rubens TaxID=7604 RepID=UPI001454F6A8|nr:adenosine receptor A2a-like [Asterias rubens]
MEDIPPLRIYQTIVCILGIIGNALVCVVIWKISAMQTRINAFIFHQAVIDFLGSMMTLLKSEVKVPDPIPSNALGWFICHVWSGFLIFSLYVMSTFNLLVLTMERYFANVHPLKHQAALTTWPRLKVGIALTVCWALAFGLNIYTLVLFREENGKCVPNQIPGSKVMGILVALIQYFLPVGVMLFAYIRIGVEMKRGAARVAPAPAQHLPGGAIAPDMAASLLRARRNTFKMLLLVFITFVICWTPNQVIFLMFNLGFRLTLTEWFYYLSVAMVATNSCVNPFIYALKYRQFRKGIRRILKRVRKRDENVGTDESQSNNVSNQITT